MCENIQGKSEGFDSCDQPSNLSQIVFKSSIFGPYHLKFDGWPRQIVGYLFYPVSSFEHHFISIGKLKLESQSGNNWLGSIFFALCDLEIWQMTSKNNRAPFLWYLKLCASFHSHQSIQSRDTVWKRAIWFKIGYFFAPCDLWIWLMTLKNNKIPQDLCIIS